MKKTDILKENYKLLTGEIRSHLIDMVKESEHGEISLSKPVMLPIMSNQLKLRKTKDGIKEIPFQTIEMARINRLALCASSDGDNESYDVDEILFCDEFGHEYGEEDVYGGIMTAFSIIDLIGIPNND